MVELFPVWNDLPLMTVTESPLTPTRDGSEEYQAGRAPPVQLPVAVMLWFLAMTTEPSGWRPVEVVQVQLMVLVVTVPAPESLLDGSATALAVTVTLPALRQESVTVFWFVSLIDTMVVSRLASLPPSRDCSPTSPLRWHQDSLGHRRNR